MSENDSHNGKYVAIILHPDSEKVLGRISLVGDPIPASEWIRTNGPLQGFAIIDGRDQLEQAWVNQDDVLLRTDYGQCSIKIVTYPTEGEDQGYLDFTSEIETFPNMPPERPVKAR